MSDRPIQSYPVPLRVSFPTPKTLPNLDGMVRAMAAMHGITRAKVARITGMSQSGMDRLLKAGNPRVGQLMALSEAVQFNLFDPYLRQMPEHLRATTETSQLEQQLAQMQQEKDTLQQELEAVKRERDLLLSIVKGGAK